MIIYEKNQPNSRHADDFHESGGPTLKGFKEGFHRNKKPTSCREFTAVQLDNNDGNCDFLAIIFRNVSLLRGHENPIKRNMMFKSA